MRNGQKNFVFILILLVAATVWVISNDFRQNKVTQKGSPWRQVIGDASWKERAYANLLVFQNKIWILGGVTTADSPGEETGELVNDSKVSQKINAIFSSGKKLNDVWFSPDGARWNEATVSAPWSARRSFSSLVFDDKIWVFGGFGDKGNLADVWRSSNGVDWELVTDSAPWGQRRGHTVLVYKGKIWLLGGAGGNPDLGWEDTKNDVWCSSNGKDWEAKTDSAPWNPRMEHISLVFDDKIWVIGGWGKWGENYNDVWSFSDGAGWIKSAEQVDWSPRWGHAGVSYDDKIWILGGNLRSEYEETAEKSSDINEVWFSKNGIDWEKEKELVPWSPRRKLSAVVFQNKIWIAGGFWGKYEGGIRAFHDVWDYVAE
ncbi:MAG: hypothetical protein FJZ04_01685 [Candidatus Moranbacteria bacterium]|nr:hypothetical protein [Candidatus Moranbacteria bacterium]